MKSFFRFDSLVVVYAILGIAGTIGLAFLSAKFFWVGIPVLLIVSITSFFISRSNLPDKKSMLEMALFVFCLCGIVMAFNTNKLKVDMLSTFVQGSIESFEVEEVPDEGGTPYISEKLAFRPYDDFDRNVCQLIVWGAFSICAFTLVVMLHSFNIVKGE